MLRTSGIYRIWHLLLLAFPLALLLLLLTPGTSQAYAILLRSDPASNAVLNAAPAQVRLWFSENLNIAASSTATIVDANNQNVDVNGGLVLPTDTRELDVALQPGLQPGPYTVIWHSQSSVDGNVFSGSFVFTVANPGGSLPQTHSALANPNQLAPGQLTGVAIFKQLMAALISLCLLFWIGGQVWHMLVLDAAPGETSGQDEIEQLTLERFARRFSLPALRVLFLANIGILLGQALSLTNGRWDIAFSPTLLVGLLTSGNFGAFWLLSEAATGLAIMVETYLLFKQQYEQKVGKESSWLDTLFALALLITTTLTIYTTAASDTPGSIELLVDGLHLLAAALWPGCICYLCLVSLPVLARQPLAERTRALLTLLGRLVPLAFSGAILTVLSGTFKAIARITSLDQLLSSASGDVLVVQALCIVLLLIAMLAVVLRLQPGLARAFQQYEAAAMGDKDGDAEKQTEETDRKLIEQDMVWQVNRLTIMIRWTLLPSVALIVSIGVLAAL